MSLKLYPYQLEGVAWLLCQRRAILADVMGLGKTAQALAAVGELTRSLRPAERVAVVVLCPAIAQAVWRVEAARWLGPAAKRVDLTVMTYARAAAKPATKAKLRAFLAGAAVGVLILDEAQALKNPSSKRTRTVYGMHARAETACLVNARPDLYVWPLSGTLMPNNVTELFPHVRALAPELIQTPGGTPMNAAEFAHTYADMVNTPFGWKVKGTRKDMSARLRALLSRIVLRRRLEDVALSLPEIVWSDPITVEPDPHSVTVEDQRELAGAEAELRQRVAATRGEVELRSLFTAADAVVLATVRRVLAQMKARPVAAQLEEELKDGAYDKVVVFACHRAALAEMAQALAEFQPVVIQGGDSDLARERAVHAFQTDPAVRVALVMIQTANTALTLTAAAQVVFLEQSWVPAENLQAAKRCHRIGQARPVMVRVFTTPQGSDQMVAQTIQRKLVGLQAVDMI